MYDPETAGYLAKAAFLRALGIHAGAGAVAGGVAGALNNDGQTSLGSRVAHGAAGGAIGGAVIGGAPGAWGAVSKKVRPHLDGILGAAEAAAHPPVPMTHGTHAILGGIGGVLGGVANTGGES